MESVIIRRTYLVRVVQEYAVDVPPGMQPVEKSINENFGAFDEYVVEHGVLGIDETEGIDDDQLTLEVVTS